MSGVPSSGLISPSPSMSELDKAGNTNASHEEKEAQTDANSITGEKTADANGVLPEKDFVEPNPVTDEKGSAADDGADRTGPDVIEVLDPGAEIKLPLSPVDGPSRTKHKKKGKGRRRSRSSPRHGIRSRSVSPVSVSYMSDSSSNSLNLGLPSRRNRTVNHMAAYLRSLEKRVTDLEEGAESPISRSRRSSIASSINSIDLPRRDCLPQWKEVTWEEYLKEKGRAIPDKAHALEILIDEPILFHQLTRKKHGHDAVTLATSKEVLPVAARRSEGLPSRVRINSDFVIQHIWRISKRRFPIGKPGHPRTMLRPYKLLYLLEAELREALADMEAKFKANQDQSEKTKPKDTDVGMDPAANEPPVEISDPETGEENTTELSSHPPAEDPVKSTDIDDELKDADETKDDNTKVNDVNGDQIDATKSDDVLEKEKEKDKKKKGPTFEERLFGEEGINEMRCLIGFIDKYLRPVQNEFDSCTREKVRFSELWHLLKPDQLLYVREKNCPQHMWRCVQATGGRPYLSPYVPPPPGPPVMGPPPPPGAPAPPQEPSKAKSIAAGYDMVSPFVVDCEYIDYNGVRFGPIFRKFYIDPFEDEVDITSLSVVPYRYAVKYNLINEQDIRVRGERFLQFTEPKHQYYSGKTLVRNPLGILLTQTPEEGYFRPGPPQPVSEETVESEVMVDFDRTFNTNPNWSPRLGEDIIFEMMDGRECREPGYEDNVEDIDYDMEWDRQMRNDIMATINVQTQRYFSKDEIPKDNDVLLLPTRVYAFILRSRKWAALDIDSLKEIKARKNGFEDLELPTGHKDVVQALVQTHFRRTERKGKLNLDEDDEEQFDLVRDKGKGLIILLHGAPGVGKTSTAECVAESNNKPLLPITCGDLGITAQDVERKLEMNFRLAQAWGCVLLLDEADVFLAQRTSSDLERNAVVSVFLRVLEYYEGILFLTTNRVGAFDEAFKSRIHMALFYPWLNKIQTIKIWDMQMRRIKERLKTIEIDREQILTYASMHFDSQCQLTGGTGWNGRQIRNAFQSATALAQFEPATPVHLQVRHFEIVAKAAAEFDDYLIRTTGHSDAERAAFNMIRTDSFNPNPRNPMSWENMNAQTRGYGGAGPAFGGGMGSQMSGGAQAAFGNQNNFGGGQQNMQGMQNQGNFGMGGMGMSQGMPFQQTGYGMQQGPSSVQSAFMGMGGGGGQMGNQSQMWPLQNQGQSAMTGMQQGSLNAVAQQIQSSGQDGAGAGAGAGAGVGVGAGPQTQGQSPLQQGQATGGMGTQQQQATQQQQGGFGGQMGFQQFPQQGQQGFGR